MVPTRNLERKFLHLSAFNVYGLASYNTTEIIAGDLCEVVNVGLFMAQVPPTSTPDGKDIVASYDSGANWIRQTLGALTTDSTGTLIGITSGGTGNSTGAATNIAGGSANSILYQNGANVTAFLPSNPSSVLSTDTIGAPYWATTLTQNTTGNAATATKATNISGGNSHYIPVQTAAGVTSFITPVVNNSLLATDSSGVPEWTTTMPGVNSGSTLVTDPTTGSTGILNSVLSNVRTKTTATNLLGGSANSVPYQTAPNTTSFMPIVNNAVVVTSATGVPSESTVLPPVNSGATIVTDPTTSSLTPLNTTLANIMAYLPGVTYSATTSSPKSIDTSNDLIQSLNANGATLTLSPGIYLISFSVSQQFISNTSDITSKITSTGLLYNHTTASIVAGTVGITFSVNVTDNNQYSGGSASATIPVTLTTTTTFAPAIQILYIASNNGTDLASGTISAIAI